MSSPVFDWTNKAQVLAAVRKWPEIFAEEIMSTLELAAMLLAGKTADLAPVGIGSGGNLANSIGVDRPAPTGLGWGIVYGTNAPHAEPIEYGRAPGSRMPPVDEIARWVYLKGPQLGMVFADEEEAQAIAFMIARKIAARGFASGPVPGVQGGTAWAMFSRAQKMMESDVQQAFKDCQERIAKRCSLSAA